MGSNGSANWPLKISTSLSYDYYTRGLISILTCSKWTSGVFIFSNGSVLFSTIEKDTEDK